MSEKIINVGLLSNLKPRVNFANSMTATPGQEWGPRTIPDCQLIYVISGQGVLELGQKRYKLSSGDCVFYGENSPHRLISSEIHPLQFSSIHFDWNVDSPDPVHPIHGIKYCSLSELTLQPSQYKISIDQYGDILFPHCFSLSSLDELFAKVVQEYMDEENGYKLVLRGILMQLLTFILRFQVEKGHYLAAREKIVPALELIRKQPNINWTSSKLAEVCGYHPTYFASVFRESTGYSPKRYLILERIRKAKQLLLERVTLDEVAVELGYTSIHYFCRNFKTETGLTPTEYKLQSLEV